MEQFPGIKKTENQNEKNDFKEKHTKWVSAMAEAVAMGVSSGTVAIVIVDYITKAMEMEMTPGVVAGMAVVAGFNAGRFFQERFKKHNEE